MLLQSMQDTGKNFSLDYAKSAPIKAGMSSSPRGYVPGEHMHHTAIVDVYEPIYRNTHPTEAALLNDFAASLGVPMGNHPKNFVSMPEGDHLSGMHGYAGENRIQLNNLSAAERAEVDKFLNRIADAPFEAKKEALRTMIEYGQPIMDDRLRDLGYAFKSREQLAREYQDEMRAEHQQDRNAIAIDALRREIESRQHFSPSGKALRGQALSEARIGDLLAMEDPSAPAKRMAGGEAMDMYLSQSPARIDSPGASRDKVYYIDADNVRINGRNGNGNGVAVA